MTTKTKTTARERLINFALSQGWELNPLRQKAGFAGINLTPVQDPNAFRKSDGEGGFWEITLDYSMATSLRESNRLRQVSIGHRDANGQLQVIGRESANITTVWLSADYADGWPGSINAHIWNVTHGVTSNTLRQRAELLFANLPLVLWLAEESNFLLRKKRAAAEQARKEKEALRRRPLDITVEKDEWRTLVRELDQASHALRWADGLTDLPASLADLEEAVAKIRAVVRNARVDVVG